MKKKILAICMSVLLMIGVAGCGAKAECNALINKLEDAVVQMDIDAILDCYNPDKVAPLKLILDTIGSGTDAVKNAVYDLLGITVEEGEDTKEAIDNVKLDAKEFEIESESGTVTCQLTIEMGEDTVEKVLVFEVIKIDDQWYIDGIK